MRATYIQAMPTKAMGTHILLLRGINVGGKNRIAMSDLRAMAEDLGCCSVRSFIQSGNLVLQAPTSLAVRLPELLQQRILKELKLAVPVVARSLSELKIAADPKRIGDFANTPDFLQVGFLSSAPSRKSIASLDPNRSPGDSLKALGNEIYLHLPNGAARTKYTTAYFDKALGCVTTFRNWRSVQALLELAELTSRG